MNRRGGTLVWVFLIFVILLVVGLLSYYAWYRGVGVWQGVHYSVDATVTRVEESTKYFPHTYVNVKINEMTSETYLFYGTGHGIKINAHYHFEFDSGVIWRWDELEFVVVGWLSRVTPLEG